MTDDIVSFIPRGQFRPYYETLDSQGKRWYSDLLAGMANYEQKIVISGWTNEDTSQVYKIVREIKGDIPELYFVDYDRVGYCEYIAYGSGEWDLWFVPNYHFTQKETKAIEVEVSRRARGILASLKGKTKLEKLQALHDWLIGRYKYEKHDNRYVQEAPGPLLYGTSVCEGVAKAYKWLCDRAGIKCHVIIGHAGEPLTSEDQDRSLHAWNIVDFGSGAQPVWRHVDVTWDALMSGRVKSTRYDYFGLSDNVIACDHEIGYEKWYPVCETSTDWYRMIGAYARGPEELARILEEACAKGQTKFTLRLPFHNENDITTICYPIISKAIRHASNRSFSYRIIGVNYRIGIYTFTYEYTD